MNTLFEQSYGFEKIAIKQKKNICKSRLDVNIRSEIIKGVYIDVPLIGANMSTVCDSNFCIKLYKEGALGILHRAMPKEFILEEITKISKECKWVAGSIGVGEVQYELAKDMIWSGCNILVIDVAHGYSSEVIELGKKIKKYNPKIKIILGNTVNTGLLEETYDFADAIKVGVGQGLVCLTKNTAGCTEKQFSAVLKFKELSKKYGVPIISDGSIRESADFVKSIAAGANSAMAGKIFAACPESSAPVENINDRPMKLYAGMASSFVQDKWKGGLKSGTCAEGTITYLEIGSPVKELLEQYAGALRSGITYAGGNDIRSFQDNAEFILI